MEGTSPAAWHPDPTGRHELRYWDGGQWSEHVSDGGRQALDPLAGTGGAANTTGSNDSIVYVDTELKVGLTKRKRLRIDDVGVTWDGDHVPFASTTAFTYHAARLAVANTQFGLELWQGKKRTSVTFTGGDDMRAVWAAASDVLFERLGRPTLESAFERVEAGETVELGGWTFDRSGASQGKKSMPWSAPYRLVPSTMSQFPCTYVNAEIDGKERQIGVFGADSAHSCIVPIVFESCARMFGGR